MLKKTLIAGTLLTLTLMLGFWLLKRPLQTMPQNTLLTFVPGNNLYTLECKSYYGLKSEISKQIAFLQFANQWPAFANLEKKISFADSALKSNVRWDRYRDSISLLISYHLVGPANYATLFTVELPKTFQQLNAQDVFQQIVSNAELKRKKYDEETIYYTTIGNESIFFIKRKNIFQISDNAFVIEDAIRQGNLKFQSTNRLGNNKCRMRFDLKKAQALFPSCFDVMHFNWIKSLKYFGEKLEVDGSIANAKVVLDGEILSSDSTASIAGICNEQKSQKLEIQKVLPGNVGYLIAIGVSNAKVLYKDYTKFLEAHHDFYNYKNNVERLKYGESKFDLNRFIIDHLDHELGVFNLIPEKLDLPQQHYAFFGSNNLEQILGELSGRDTLHYKGKTLYFINIQELFPIIFGELFSQIHKTYCVKLGEYIIVGNSYESLKYLIEESEQLPVLALENNFKKMKDGAPSEYSILTYANLQRINQKDAQAWMQINVEKGNYFAHIGIDFNPSASDVLVQLWEVKDEKFLQKDPEVIKDKLNRDGSLVVNLNSKSCMVDKNGDVLWRKLKEKAKGKKRVKKANSDSEIQFVRDSISIKIKQHIIKKFGLINCCVLSDTNSKFKTVIAVNKNKLIGYKYILP